MSSLVAVRNTGYSLVGAADTISVVALPVNSVSKTVTGGALPTGMTLSSGSIHGTPTVPGVFTFEITAGLAVQTLRWEVFAANPNIRISASPNGVVWGVLNQAYLMPFTVARFGGAPSTIFDITVTAGSLPPGMAVYRWNATSGFWLYGTPTTVGVFVFTLTATGNLGDIGHAIFTIAINATQTSNMLIPPAVQNTAYTFQISQDLPASVSATPGPPYTIFRQPFASEYPAWLSVSSTGLLFGTPAPGDTSNSGTQFPETSFALSGFGPYGDMWLPVDSLAAPPIVPPVVNPPYIIIDTKKLPVSSMPFCVVKG